MLVINAYLMLAVIPIIYRQCKGTTKFELHKEKERFFQLPLLLYSFFIPSLLPPYSRQQSTGLFLRNESLPGLVIVEDADLGNLTLRFVHIFNRRIGDIFRCPFYTVCLRLVKERWRSRGV